MPSSVGGTRRPRPRRSTRAATRTSSPAGSCPAESAQLAANELLVGGRVQEALRLAGVRDLEDDHPSLPVRVLVHDLRRVLEGLVRLDGLAGLRELDVHNVRELGLRVVRDPDGRPLPLEAGPLVVLRVPELWRD